MEKSFRKATPNDLPFIWEILKSAIARRKEDGSDQWQDGYPNPQVISEDIDKGAGYVLMVGDEIVGYVAIFINDEPEYANLKGQWLSNDDFMVYHRVAIAENWIGKGLAKVLLGHVEQFARQKGISSIKADTNFDNIAMLKLFENLDYEYCGEVYFRGSPRKAYEKIISIE